MCWVWATFAPPGVVHIQVSDPLNQELNDNFLVGKRQSELNSFKDEDHYSVDFAFGNWVKDN